MSRHYYEDEDASRRAVSWAAPTLRRFGAELHYAADIDGWDIEIKGGPMQGWHSAQTGYELAALAHQLGEAMGWRTEAQS